MLWIGMWIHHQAVTTTCVGSDKGTQLTSCEPVALQTSPLCSGRGSMPAYNGSHIPSQHIAGVWKPSYAVDGHMEPSIRPLPPHVGYNYKWHKNWAVIEALTQYEMVPTSCPCIYGVWQASYAADGHMEPSSGYYHHMCWPRLGKSAEILHPSWATNDTRIVQWLRL
jgi:hypothetical protein